MGLVGAAVLLAGSAAAGTTPVFTQAASPLPLREFQVGERLPDLPLQGLNGPARQLASYRGKPLLINVWASWCGPCRQEMGSLERLSWRYSSNAALTIIGISTDDDAQAALGFLRRSNATLSHFIDSQLRLETALGAKRLPLTVLVDEKGQIVQKVVGAQEWDSPQALAFMATAFRNPALAKPPR